MEIKTTREICVWEDCQTENVNKANRKKWVSVESLKEWLKGYSHTEETSAKDIIWHLNDCLNSKSVRGKNE